MTPLIQLKTTPPLLIILTLMLIASLPNAQAVVPAPPGAIPGSLLQKGLKPFKASPPVLETQELVGVRSF